MENTLIPSRLKALRLAMEKAHLTYYLLPTADYHASEYTHPYFGAREYFSGFKGSAGTLLVWQTGAGLWTDGRYFIQAAKELEGTGIDLFRAGDEGVPTIEAFLKEKIQKEESLGLDGRCISTKRGLALEEICKEAGAYLIADADLATPLWQDRPAFPAGKIWVLEDALAGTSVQEKLCKVRACLVQAKAKALLLTKLDDIAWLFHVRGEDVQFNPVAMAYAFVTLEEAIVFVQEQAVNEKVRAHFAAAGVQLYPYAGILSYIEGLAAKPAFGAPAPGICLQATVPGTCLQAPAPGSCLQAPAPDACLQAKAPLGEGLRVLLDPESVNFLLFQALSACCEVLQAPCPVEALKAVKNETEQAHMREIYLKDSVALTKFIFWLKTHIATEPMTEITAADKLEAFRREIPEFFDLSFTTISAYKGNAAMMHYEATEEACAVLAPEGFLLVDSGGQYLGGTTDVTRTITLGALTEEEKAWYSLVAAGMLELSNATWLYGCTGRNLDILARQPLWKRAMDYQCGTGHGVGYMLNVHEGPQGIRWKYREDVKEAVLEAGMDVSNEPGVYIEGKLGIRIENIMLAQKGIKNAYGQFLHFETLTWVPLESKAMVPALLNDTQRGYYNAYQKAVYEKLAPYLSLEEAAWLREETKPI